MAAMVMVGNDVLPEDVMLNVLSRLPVKTLKRFSCVCKSWFVTFQNPNFVRNHYITNTITGSNLNIMVLNVTNGPRYEYYSSSKPTMEIRERTDFSSIGYFPFRRMVGECEGLVCFYDPITATSGALFNPATRQVKLLPQPPTRRDARSSRRAVYVLGLGFDYKTNDYKVVRIVNDFRRSYVELYYLSTNSWRLIHFPSELEELYPRQTHLGLNLYLKGCCHWLIHGTKAILAFDMSLEVFQTLPLPAHLNGISQPCSLTEHPKFINGTSHPGCLRVFDNYLALFLRPDDVTDCFEIHVMKEYGVMESWTKQLVVGPILGVYDILGHWRSGDQWFFSTHDSYTDYDNYKIKLYDTTTKVVKDLQTDSYCPPELVIVTESLISLTAI